MNKFEIYSFFQSVTLRGNRSPPWRKWTDGNLAVTSAQNPNLTLQLRPSPALPSRLWGPNLQLQSEKIDVWENGSCLCRTSASESDEKVASKEDEPQEELGSPPEEQGEDKETLDLPDLLCPPPGDNAEEHLELRGLRGREVPEDPHLPRFHRLQDSQGLQKSAAASTTSATGTTQYKRQQWGADRKEATLHAAQALDAAASQLCPPRTKVLILVVQTGEGE
ncbi:Hypothetical predicted protein [Podarcis lilfordi]|uniref:Uncharacterized protein n=1 Tax=Podarcis lilfordi TaxID=74358 RepID=A0AA35LM65_9SAUR|nr:Hypothetical predicted protein [Podarcis lilfordi]